MVLLNLGETAEVSFALMNRSYNMGSGTNVPGTFIHKREYHQLRGGKIPLFPGDVFKVILPGIEQELTCVVGDDGEISNLGDLLKLCPAATVSLLCNG